MKAELACVLLVAVAVNAGGGGGQGGPISPGGLLLGLGRCGGASGGFRSGPYEYGRCACATGRSNACRFATGSQIKGCPNTNQYLQCTGTVCANQTCPSGQVWNRTLNACAACGDGLHVAANLQICLCNQGKTFARNGTCVDCPTGAVNEADQCYCAATKVFDSNTYSCRDCPAGSAVNTKQQCQCTSATQLWSDVDWTCKDCPGEWIPKQSSPRRPNFNPPQSRCSCTGATPVFDDDAVACYACPADATLRNGRCICNSRFQFFNVATKKCECPKGYIAQPTGGGCVVASDAATQVPVPGNP